MSKTPNRACEKEKIVVPLTSSKIQFKVSANCLSFKPKNPPSSFLITHTIFLNCELRIIAEDRKTLSNIIGINLFQKGLVIQDSPASRPIQGSTKAFPSPPKSSSSSFLLQPPPPFLSFSALPFVNQSVPPLEAAAVSVLVLVSESIPGVPCRASVDRAIHAEREEFGLIYNSNQ